MRTSSIVLAGILALAVGGLPAEEPPLQPIKDRVILFAPVAVPEQVASDYPDAARTFASDMATRITALVPGAKAWASDTLPVSDAASWEADPLGATSGAHLTVLTVIEELSIKEGTSSVTDNSRIFAKVTLRALDITGQQRWFKTVVADVPLSGNPKNPYPGGQPAKASWEGCKKALLAFKYWLTQTGQEEFLNRTTASDDPPPDPIGLVRLEITSDPEGAAIWVNGIQRGITPMTVPLPAAKIQLKLTKDAYQVWSRELTPVTGMKLAPALEPLP